MRTPSALVVAAALAACGGNGNNVDGSYRGQSIDVSDAVLFPPVVDSQGSSVSVVVLESASDACTLLQSQAVNNTSTVSIVLGIQTPDGRIAPPTVAGTYEIDGPLFRDPGTKLAAVAFNVFGGCGPGTTANAVSGSVHLTHVATAPDGNPRGIDGSFNARFDTGETFSGAFHVSLCPSARLLVGICR
ncbi:MAG: hypothetical protein E6J62_18170 [Deltaproteobacteria bacterium]|nr:MAG: hypothetical protein E6J85_05505 [Deltaproteobacteria bacterium]TMB28189.1 MAG: hypothetical protein E6J62_18170 [Deltaproteobacteria bacterium]TMB29264.1 MAG: hypothetical protein E6J61_15805 [Deltaproteobacteria bacterium]